MNALGEMGEKASMAVPSLKFLLRKDEDWGMRKSAVRALVRIGKQAVPMLIETVKDKEKAIYRSEAIDVLNKMAKKLGYKNRQELIAAFEDENSVKEKERKKTKNKEKTESQPVKPETEEKTKQSSLDEFLN